MRAWMDTRDTENHELAMCPKMQNIEKEYATKWINLKKPIAYGWWALFYVEIIASSL